MPLTKQQKDLAQRIGRLLAQSPLDDDLKGILLENMDKLPEPALERLLTLLEKERVELTEASADIELFLKEQEKNWQQLENDQKNYAQKFIEDKLKDLTKE